MRLLGAHSAHGGFAAILAASVTQTSEQSAPDTSVLLQCHGLSPTERDILSRGNGCSAVAASVDRAVFEAPLLDPGVMWKKEGS